MTHDDFAQEPVPGLPERPPSGEEILWQGRPNWWALTKSALSFWWVMGYFGLLAVWRVAAVAGDMAPVQALAAALPLLILGAVVGVLLILTAWVQARATVYTLTTHRIAMRIGAALTITLNLPYSQIASADLDLRRDGTGTIALTTLGDVRISYLVCWPHVRPWRFPTRHALRCIPDAQPVAELLAEAAQARVRRHEPPRAATPSPVAAE